MILRFQTFILNRLLLWLEESSIYSRKLHYLIRYPRILREIAETPCEESVPQLSAACRHPNPCNYRRLNQSIPIASINSVSQVTKGPAILVAMQLTDAEADRVKNWVVKKLEDM